MSSKSVYYIWSEEAYLIDRKIREIVDQVHEKAGEEPELVMIDGDELSSMEIEEALQFSGLFALSRVVVIKNPSWLSKNTRKSKKAEEIARVLKDYFVQAQAGQSLIICCPEHISSNPAAKLLEKQAEAINVKPLNPKELGDWIKGELKQRNLQIEPAALNLLVNSGQDMYYLQNLIEKFSLMMSSGTVVAKDLEAELEIRQETKVFKLTDALLSRNLAASLEAFYQLQEQGQPYLLMLHMISRQLLIMSKVKFYMEAGYSSAQIADLTNQKDFVVRKMTEKSSRFAAADIRYLFNKLLEIDMGFKRESKDPQIIMETLMVEFCSNSLTVR